jgi:hypothetical protein
MKAKYLYIFLVIFSLFLQYGCERELTSEGVSRTTTYAVVTIGGDNPTFLAVGEAYTEPGATTNTGDPVTISGTVDVNTPGVYTVSYSATNIDGFTNSVNRTVYVSNTGDLVSSIEGLYTATVVRVDPAETWDGLQFIRIWNVGGNDYELSHGLGGFYALGRAYGYDYAAQGAIITANNIPLNDFAYADALIPGFGLPVTLSNLIVDAGTKTITFTADIPGYYTFNITLVQYEY